MKKKKKRWTEGGRNRGGKEKDMFDADSDSFSRKQEEKSGPELKLLW
jgi:hypothetical protein